MRKLFPDAVEKARNKFGSADYQKASPVMRQSMSLCIREDLTALLPNVTASTLLIWGEKDTATPLSDGKLMDANLRVSGKDMAWVDKTLAQRGAKIRNTWYLAVDQENHVIFIPKEAM